MSLQTPPPPAPHSPPHPHGPPPRGGGIGLVIALVVGIALCAVLLVGGGVAALALTLGPSDTGPTADPSPSPTPTDEDEDEGSETPEEAFEAFVDASNAQDCAALVQHPITDLDTESDCEAALDEAREAAEEEGLDLDSFTLEIDDLEVVSEDDESATISVVATQAYEIDGDQQEYETTYEYELEKDGDRWLVVDVVTEVSDPVGPDGA